MVPTLADSAAGYRNMWSMCAIDPGHASTVKNIVENILAHKAEYQGVQAGVGGNVPWFFMACLHSRESDCDFSTYLGNGDPLSQPTTDVPAGRGPFRTFIAGAIDSMTMEGFTKITSWPIEQMLYSAEAFNGWGYTYRGKNSPYVWAGTNQAQIGKYVSDGSYNGGVWDTQMGVAAILKGLQAADADVAAALGAA